MSFQFRATWLDSAGAGITAATGKTIALADVDTGELYDFSTGGWVTGAPVTPTAALTEDTDRAGDYYYTCNPATWGNRTVKATLYLAKGLDVLVYTDTRTVLGGVAAVPVFVPAPPAGTQSLILYVRTGAGAIPATAPSGYCYTLGGAGYNPSAQDSGVAGTWNAGAGALTWNVPQNSIAKVEVPGVNELSYWTVTTADIVLNTATPLKRL